MLAYQEGEDIVIIECKKDASLSGHEDEDVDFWRWRSECRDGWEMERGRAKSRIPEAVFKKSLLLALKVPGDYEPELQEQITVYNEKERQGREQEVLIFLEERERLMAQIELLEELVENFTTRFNWGLVGASDTEELLSTLRVRFEEMQWQVPPRYSDGVDNIFIANYIEGMVDNLIEIVKDNKRLELSIHRYAEGELAFNLLRTLLETPVLPWSFVRMREGEFMMGSPDGEKDRDIVDEVQKRVRLTKDFEIGTSEVTQLQYFLIMDENPSFLKGKTIAIIAYRYDGEWMCPNNPAENMSWDDLHSLWRILGEVQCVFRYARL